MFKIFIKCGLIFFLFLPYSPTCPASPVIESAEEMPGRRYGRADIIEQFSPPLVFHEDPEFGELNFFEQALLAILLDLTLGGITATTINFINFMLS